MMHTKTNVMPHGAMGKRQLAVLYMPDIDGHSATNCLMRWINGNARLKAELEKTGLRRKQKVFTPLQVDLILRFLGEP